MLVETKGKVGEFNKESKEGVVKGTASSIQKKRGMEVLQSSAMKNSRGRFKARGPS